MDRAPAIGIDFGTTYSCVGVFQNGKVQIISDMGDRTSASCVAFTDPGRLMGNDAKREQTMNLVNTIFDAKHLFGLKFEDPSVQSDMKHWPFEVVNVGGKPKLSVEYKGETKLFFPEVIASMILTKLKENAEEYLGKVVTDAVLTVPVHFNRSQRQAIKDSATIAGLNVLRVISEPTAAALSYGLHCKQGVGDNENGNGEKNVLIFDLGGGNLGVSILAIEDLIFEVKSTAGVAHLGGGDFDNRMVAYFVQEIKRKYKQDISTNKRALLRLRIACEQAKRILSSLDRAKIEIDSVFDGIDLYTTITRPCFEQMNEHLFSQILEPVEKALRDAKLDKAQIHDIVLVGGSTRIPKIQKMLQDFFNGKELGMTRKREEAVAYGAAVQAAVLRGDKSKEIQDLVLIDAVPQSLGIEMADGVISTIIKRNDPIPTKQTQTITTNHENQPDVHIEVFEGEHEMTKENHLLGSFKVVGIPPGPQEIQLTFDVDTDGTLYVDFIVTSTGQKITVKITSNEEERLSIEEIERMINEEKLHRADEKKQKERSDARAKLATFCFRMKRSVEVAKVKGKICEEDRRTVLNKCNYIYRWFNRNTIPETTELQQMLMELKNICKPIMVKIDNGPLDPEFLVV